MGLLEEEEYGLINISRILAVSSFLFGTLLLSGYYFTESFPILLIGFVFVVITFIVNLIFLISLLGKFFISKIKRKKVFVSIVIILLNIPISVGYYYFAMTIFNRTIN